MEIWIAGSAHSGVVPEICVKLASFIPGYLYAVCYRVYMQYMNFSFLVGREAKFIDQLVIAVHQNDLDWQQFLRSTQSPYSVAFDFFFVCVCVCYTVHAHMQLCEHKHTKMILAWRVFACMHTDKLLVLSSDTANWYTYAHFDELVKIEMATFSCSFEFHARIPFFFFGRGGRGCGGA